jgi:MYXO-CTERM domain-containing protein
LPELGVDRATSGAKEPPPAAGTGPVLAGTGSVANAGRSATSTSPQASKGCGSCSVGSQRTPPGKALAIGLSALCLLGLRSRRRSCRAARP